MNLIRFLLLHSFLLAWEAKALLNTPPREVPCIADANSESTCSEYVTEAIDINQRKSVDKVTGSKVAPNVKDFDRKYGLGREVSEVDESATVESEGSKRSGTNRTTHTEPLESFQTGVTQGGLRQPDELVNETEELKNKTVQHNEVTHIPLDREVPTNNETKHNNSPEVGETEYEFLSNGSRNDVLSNDDSGNKESDNDYETSTATMRDEEIKDEMSQNGESKWDERNHRDRIISEEKLRDELMHDELPQVDYPQHETILAEHNNNQTIHSTVNEISLDNDSPLLSVLNDSSVISEITSTDAQLNNEYTSLADDGEYSFSRKNKRNDSSSDRSIAKSFENDISSLTAQGSRSFDGNKPEDMTSGRDDKIKSDDGIPGQENFTLDASDQLDREDAKEQKINEVAFEKSQGSSVSPSVETYVRKCCEEHEYFHIETQQCEETGGDTRFMNFVKGLLLPNSTGHLQLSTGRLQLCPGTTEPPLVSEVRSDIHTLQAFGYLKDEAFNVKYDHDNYCLELAASTDADLSIATFVLAHCLPSSSDMSNSLSVKTIDMSENLFSKTTVRKCCGEEEFFSTRNQACEPAGSDPGFVKAVRLKVAEQSITDFQLITGLLLECPNTGKAPFIEEVNFHSHSLLPAGYLKDDHSADVYDHDHYCLEIAAVSNDKLTSSPLVLAYCSSYRQEGHLDLPSETLVRKCCTNDQYFSTKTQKCEPTEGETAFDRYLKDIQTSDITSSVHYVNGKIQQCPSSGDIPLVTQVNSESHAILAFGLLKELTSGIAYDHDNYCLELSAEYPGDAKGILVAAYCPVPTVQILTRKCCNLDQYFDDASNRCQEHLGNTSSYKNLVNVFSRTDPRITTASIEVGMLKCRNTSPRMVYANEAYIHNSGQLCEHTVDICHPVSSYCIEHFSISSNSRLTPGAFVCPMKVFYKCCPSDQILTDTGCEQRNPYQLISPQMARLTETMQPQTELQALKDELCIQRIIKSTEEDIHWGVDKSGYLSIHTSHGELTTERYCVDDYQDHEDVIQTAAIMCLNEIESVYPAEKFTQYGNFTSFGKCCPHGHYLRGSECVTYRGSIDLFKEQQLRAANVADMAYVSFPICQSGQELRKYPFSQHEEEDFAVFSTNKTIKVVSLERDCLQSQQSLQKSEFCIDYSIVDKRIQPMVMACTDNRGKVLPHPEMYSLTAVLLGISCAALAVTAFSLLSRRVRKGKVELKKVNTLGGRMLLCYVLSYLMTFSLLAIGLKIDAQVGYSCSILAGFLMFFLLAAFQWNTSICLESLLLILKVKTPKCRRYLCHSLWAWGVPCIITIIALTLDFHRENLPCSVITPKFGFYQCFFSDYNAHLLYLYLPMLISVCANVFFLSAARYVRSAKLKRMELGVRRSSQTATAEEQLQDNQSKTSGQDSSQITHQNSIRQSELIDPEALNLWTESVKLVSYSGVTLMAEITAFLLTRFLALSESWYNYLWYLPSCINSLRGVGIFVILVLTPENCHEIFKAARRLCTWVGSGLLACRSRLRDTLINHPSVPKGQSHERRQAGRHRTSIASELRPTAESKQTYSLTKTDNCSDSTPRDGEGSEPETETAAADHHKSPLTNFVLVSLPSVDGGDVFEGIMSYAHPTLQGHQTTSDA